MDLFPGTEEPRYQHTWAIAEGVTRTDPHDQRCQGLLYIRLSIVDHQTMFVTTMPMNSHMSFIGDWTVERLEWLEDQENRYLDAFRDEDLSFLPNTSS
jgi:hypothetical protein